MLIFILNAKIQTDFFVFDMFGEYGYFLSKYSFQLSLPEIQTENEISNFNSKFKFSGNSRMPNKTLTGFVDALRFTAQKQTLCQYYQGR